jgi:hypothetical protein
MALTFKFFTDAALTSPQSGNLVAKQDADGSTPPVDFRRWLGSTTAGRRIRASSNPGVDQIALQVKNTTPVWQASTPYAQDDAVRTTAANGHRYRATNAGTSGASEPTWPTTAGATVVDGGITWQEDGALSEAAEVRLAATQGGLAGATPGAALNLGTAILSGAGSAVEFWARVDDANGVVMTDTELYLETVQLEEDAP